MIQFQTIYIVDLILDIYLYNLLFQDRILHILFQLN